MDCCYPNQCLVLGKDVQASPCISSIHRSFVVVEFVCLFGWLVALFGLVWFLFSLFPLFSRKCIASNKICLLVCVLLCGVGDGLNRMFCSNQRKCMTFPIKRCERHGKLFRKDEIGQVDSGENKESSTVSSGQRGLDARVTSRWNVN